MVFIVATPALILYSMGYRFDWQTKKIIETGVISIDVKPKDAAVYLNNILIAKKIPIRLTNRAPGSYELKISRAGYKTWEKTIDIKSRQTTYIKDIGLIKDALPTQLIDRADKNIEKIIPSTDGRYLVLISVDNGVRLAELYDTQTGATRLLSRVSQKLTQTMVWSPFNNYLLIATSDDANISVSLLSAAAPEAARVYRLSRDDRANVVWQWQKDALLPTLFTRQLNKITRLSVNGSENIFNIGTDDIWYIDNQEKLWIYADNKIRPRDSAPEADTFNIGNNEKITGIIDINNDRIIAAAKDKLLVLSRRENKQETINASALIFNPATREWLVWSPLELWSIYQHDRPAILNRTSDSIVSVFPLDKAGALLLVHSQGLSAFNPGYYVSQNIFTGAVKNASVNQQINKIFFLGKVAEREGLFELEY